MLVLFGFISVGLICRLHGNVETMAVLSSGSGDGSRRRDSIILTFEDAKISVLEFDDSVHGLRTRWATGDVGKLSEIFSMAAFIMLVSHFYLREFCKWQCVYSFPVYETVLEQFGDAKMYARAESLDSRIVNVENS